MELFYFPSNRYNLQHGNKSSRCAEWKCKFTLRHLVALFDEQKHRFQGLPLWTKQRWADKHYFRHCTKITLKTPTKYFWKKLSSHSYIMFWYMIHSYIEILTSISMSNTAAVLLFYIDYDSRCVMCTPLLHGPGVPGWDCACFSWWAHSQSSSWSFPCEFH